MSEPNEQLLSAFDGHDVDAVRSALQAGADAISPIRGKVPVLWLLQEYTRSDRLPVCLRLLLEHGAELENDLLSAVLLDDADAIRAAVERDPSALKAEVSLASAFTSLENVSLLHVAAEYGNLRAASTLLELGADVNAVGATDQDGVGGHTPIFHTVNANRNRSEPHMRLFVAAGADCSHSVEALYWGKGYEWETLFFDITPVSYALLGLLPQMHRSETDIFANVSFLLKASGRSVPDLPNVPNRYLLAKGKR